MIDLNGCRSLEGRDVLVAPAECIGDLVIARRDVAKSRVLPD